MRRAPRAPGAIDAVTKLPPPLDSGLENGVAGAAQSRRMAKKRRHRGRHLIGAKTPGGND
jgi:hypothetical protein